MLSSSCYRAIPIWKRLLSERFDELNVKIDVDLVLHDGDFVGKMCRPCAAALQRLHKLEAGVRQNICDAVESIMSENRWSLLQSRKRSLPSSDEETPRTYSRICHSLPIPSLPSVSDSQSPDVAVSFITHGIRIK